MVTKGIICDKWVGDWTELQYIDHHSSGHSSISFPFSWVAQSGAWRPSLCWDMVLIPASSLQLIWTSSRRGYIVIWHPPTSCKRHNSHSIQPFDSQGYPLIPSTGCNCYLHRCISSFDILAGVNMLHAEHTIWPHNRAAHLVMFKISLGRDLQNSMTSFSRRNSTLCLNGRNSVLCLHGPMSTFNWLFFKILKFSGSSLSCMGSSTLQPHFLSGGLLWQWWFSYPLHASVKLYPMTKLRTLNPNSSNPNQTEW